MNEASWPCPRCGNDRAFWLGPILDEQGYLVGDMLVCRSCEHHFEEVR